MLSDFDLEGKNKFQKASYYLKYYGASYTVKKALRKFGIPISEESEYMTWCRRNTASKEKLEKQRGSVLSDRLSFAVVLEADANIEQTGFKRQTCKQVSFMKITEQTTLLELLEKNKSVYYVFCGKNVKVLPEYLYEISKVLCNKSKEHISKIRPKNTKPVDVVYTDEDNCVGRKRFRPFFKPDASMQLLLNFPYLGRCFVVKRTLLEKMAKKNQSVSLLGNDWYDLSLQLFRYAEHIAHVPKVLFSNCVSKAQKTAFVHSTTENAKDCIRNYLKSENVYGKVTESDVPGFYHVEYELAVEPLVSIIIPNKDHTEDLKKCLDSLRNKSDYSNYEVIIAENNSEDAKTFAYYEKLMTEDERIHVVVWEGEFNYSAINNFAVKSAKGDLLLFLNNDTEFMEAKTLRELVVSALLPDVGAAGAMLYYEDRTIQHGGVIMGMGGFAAHALWSLTDRDEKYYPFSLCQREVSGVTGACLMVRKEVYEEVGGMGEDFVVALNDVDFCLKVRAAGYKILFNPYAKLYHYESKSRGYEDTVEKQARFQQEITRLQEKWKKELEEMDPYYNPNLTLHRADYSMDI